MIDYVRGGMHMAMEEVFVITSDIVHSKDIPDLKEGIESRIAKVNAMHAGSLKTPFTSLRGDEIQAIVPRKHYAELFRILRNLRRFMQDYTLRIGVGYGMVDQLPKDTEETSWNYNGPPFYRAREAVETLEERKKSSVHLRTCFKMFDQAIFNDILNTTYFFVEKTTEKWKPEMWTIVDYLEAGHTHEKIASILNEKTGAQKTRTGYTMKINRSGWYWVHETEENFIRLIKEMLI